MITIFINLALLEELEKEILTLEETKNFLKVSGNSDNEKILQFIKQARRFAESFCGISLIRQIYLITYNNKPIQNKQIIFPISNIDEIIEINIAACQNQILNKKDYYFDKKPQILYLKPDINSNIIKIKFSTSSNLLKIDEFKIPMLQHINILYKRMLPTNNKNELSLEDEIKNLYLPYRIIRI